MIISTLPRPLGLSDLHVVPYHGLGDKWAVKNEQFDEYSRAFQTKVEAIAYAVGQARESAASVVIHGKDGRIQDVWFYGRKTGLQ